MTLSSVCKSKEAAVGNATEFLTEELTVTPDIFHSVYTKRHETVPRVFVLYVHIYAVACIAFIYSETNLSCTSCI